MLQAFLGADAGGLGTVLVDILRVFGAVNQHHHIGGGHFSNAIAHQHIPGLAVHYKVEDAHVQRHQNRVMPSLYAVDAIADGQGQILAVTLIELAAGRCDAQHELVHQTRCV